MDTYDFNGLEGREVRDIGRLLSTDQYEKTYDFNDYSGACYLEIGEDCLVVEPRSAIDGDEISAVDEEEFEMGDLGKYSFKKFYKGVVGDEIRVVESEGQNGHIHQLRFQLNGGSFSLELKGGDRICITTN